MESEEKAANEFLVVNDLCVDVLNHDCKQRRMLELEILKLYFALCCNVTIWNLLNENIFL